MGSLANQYISQSYTSLIHLSSDTTASATLTALQDGLGNGLGIFVNTLGDISASNTIITNNIVVNTKTELTGAFALNTYFTSSTIPYVNSTQPYFTDTVYVTGSYRTNTYPPSIADVKVGWLGNGINVTNGVVTAVSKSVSGYFITMAGQSPQIAQSYRFTGQASPNATITGSLEITENLIVSGTFDIEGKVVVNDNVRINGNLEVSGSQRNTGSLFVSNEISSSTINGIGNVTAYSSSLWAEFTNIENYTSSLRAAFTASGVNTIFTNDITASNIEVRNNINVVGTLFASKVVTLIESSSIIFSSGSNILGDSILDIQTLNGDVIMSGSASLTGSMGITGNLEVKGNISSSTISGIGNVTTYSQSVDARLDFLEGPFSTSVDARLDIVEATASLYIPFSQSVDQRLGSLQVASASLQVASASLQNFSASVTSSLVSIYQTTASLNTFSASAIITASAALNTITFTKGNLTTFDVTLAGITFNSGSYLLTSSFNAYTSSTNVRLNNLETTTASLNTSVTNLNSFSSSQLIQNTTLAQVTSSLISFTGSYATTGSNTFRGNQSITGSLSISGSMVYSGSVRGQVFPLTITSQTASIDCSLGNFFTLTLVSGSATNLQATNIQPGETIGLRITQPSGNYGTVTVNGGTIRFPQAFPYNATPSGSAIDILSFQSYDTTTLFGVGVNTMR